MFQKSSYIFILYFVSAILISIFLFQTVHNRNVDEAFKDSPPRYMNLINFWIEEGFIDNFGLWPRDLESESFSNVADVENKYQSFYRNDGMGYLHPSYVVQKIHHLITGKVNFKLYIYQNQLYLIFSSIFLSFLGFRISFSYGLSFMNALSLGLVCQLLFLTFPVNLFYYWGAYPTAISSTFIILFLLLIFEMANNPSSINFRYKLATAITVFFIAHTALYVGILFLVFFLITFFSLNKKFLDNKTIIKIIILPLSLSTLFFLTQILLIKINYDPKFIGSTFMFRSGLDGDVSYYESYINLIFHRIRNGSYLYQWYEFMIFSSLSFIIYLSINFYTSKFSKNYLTIDRNAIFILFISMGAYFPYALLFTQSTVIHAKVFDPYLVIPLILVSFSNLPGILERGSNFKGFFSFIFLSLGIFFSFVNVRLYSMQYPL